MTKLEERIEMSLPDSKESWLYGIQYQMGRLLSYSYNAERNSEQMLNCLRYLESYIKNKWVTKEEK